MQNCPSGRGSAVAKRMSWPGVATSCPNDSRRLAGPPTTPTIESGIQESGGIYDLAGRLERLAFPPPQPAGTIRPPIETCRITPSEHGDIYSATDEYIRWFRSAYPNAGGGDRVKRAQVDPPPKDVGAGKRSHFYE